MNVCFVARNDFESKPGGDTVQFHMYSRAIVAAGGAYSTWFSEGPPPVADVYHAFNIDRPLEIYPRLRRIHELGRPFVVSTIHHPNDWLVRFRRLHPPGGILGRVLHASYLGSSIPLIESVKEVLRLAGHGRVGRIADLMPSWLTRVRWILNNASRVLLLTRAERQILELDFGVTIPDDRTAVIPNWVEDVEQETRHVPCSVLKDFAEPPVIVVGRIEARKNVLAVCRAADAARRPTVFIGRPNPNEPRYVAEFAASVESSRYARWIDGVARSEMGQYYRTASFLLNASYVEVSPLVDIEALQCGCPVATTRFALHHELLPRDTPQLDPYSDGDLSRILSWYPERRIPLRICDPPVCRATLFDTYESSLN
jgi:glycosyltransferase involved in cell wall biosynthesis